ncbi:MAG: 2,3-bisphosphoglycerate-independent phosphoglycerate mutase [Candidatus Micrarchaeota archaeon]
MSKAIILVMDGLGDLPDAKGYTPLSAALKPNMDRLAEEGTTGLFCSIGEGMVPGSDTSHLGIFGYDHSRYYPGRGPLEALGARFPLKEGDIALRANFATVDNGKIQDRRAGRITSDEGKLFARYVQKLKVGTGIDALFQPTVEHRGILVLRGRKLSPKITPTDPHATGILPKSMPLDPKDRDAKRTAEALNKFTKLAMQKLEKAKENKPRRKPVNAIIARGAGTYSKIPSLYDRFGIRGACIAGGALYRGVSSYVGMDVVDVKGATGTAETDLKAKGKAAIQALWSHDFVFVHIKATDSFSHDGNFEGKKNFIAKVDKEIIPILLRGNCHILITGDHSTPVKRRVHSGDPAPLLAWGPDVRRDDSTKFDEFACAKGGLGHLRGTELFHVMLNLIGKAPMVGT